ncbi:MAG: permease, partial [Leptospiraceae bacterium]|nr:permease [Leptospiraceae bacterium]
MNANWNFLLISLFGFLIAPIVVTYGKMKKNIYLFVDGFTLSSIIWVTFFHLIPESIQQEGIWAFLFFILGFLPSKLFHSTQNRLLVFVLFLLAHTLLESSVVAMSNTNTLALAVGIHNLPIGIFLFTKVQRENGKKFAIGTVVFIFLFAILGFTLGESIPSIQKFQFHLQAFIASNVIHILFESIHEKFGFHNLETNSNNKYHISSTLGAIAGILLIAFFSNEIFLTQKLQNSNRSVFSVLLKILLETAPILLLAFFLSGILRILLTPNTSNWLKNGRPFIQSLKGVIFGLPLPICSCGILPLYKTLIQTGIPATAGMAFLIATPEIGLDALLITIPLLGVEFSIYRLLSAFLVAFFISYFVGKGIPTCNISQTTEVKKILTLSEKIQLGLKYGFIELFDHIMPWILFGIMIASLFEFLVDYQTFQNIPNYIQIPLFALLGIPTYVCAT